MTAAAPLHDISTSFAPHTPPWPGDTPTSCGWTARREDGASVNLGALTTSAHIGTHADAPLHVESDWPASESLPVDVFVGAATVVRIPPAVRGTIDQAILAALLAVPENGHAAVPTRLLLHTGASVSHRAFPDTWPTVEPAAVMWLLAHGLRLLGTDAPSVDARDSKALPVHHALFSHGAYVLENLALADVVPGEYELLAQPLAVHGADAAPVRALLRPLDHAGTMRGRQATAESPRASSS